MVQDPTELMSYWTEKNQRSDTDKLYLQVNVHSNKSINCLLTEEKKQELTN